jgi:hypothetical protein
MELLREPSDSGPEYEENTRKMLYAANIVDHEIRSYIGFVSSLIQGEFYFRVARALCRRLSGNAMNII